MGISSAIRHEPMTKPEMQHDDTYDLYQQGRAHLDRGDNAQATVALEKAKRREPDKASIREALGVAYLRLRRYREAAAEFEHILDAAPANDYAHYCLGRCLTRMGQPRLAAGHYKMA
ncbi:MAG: protein-glutamine gamma-glutamyltransferase, partial [Gaiellales bacterium]|nr:protein-glutamine gamma-glutamyltransferase [Gaiellales bacterium]